MAAGTCYVIGGTIGYAYVEKGTLSIESNTKFDAILTRGSSSGAVTISSGAILDLTGNTNSAPIAPGGGITFEEGGATVKVGDSTASSSYMMDNVTLPAGAKLTNTAVVNLGGTNVFVSSGSTAITSGCTVTGGLASGSQTQGGAFNVRYSGTLYLENTVVSGNSATNAGGGLYVSSGAIYMSNSIVSGNTGGSVLYGHDAQIAGGTMYVNGGCYIGYSVLASNGKMVLTGSNAVGCVTERDASRYGTVTLSNGAIVDLTGNTNATPINPGGGVIVDGGCQVITSAGTTVSIAGGTYTQINNDGTTE